MEYTRKLIKDLTDYTIQQIRDNQAQANFLMREKQLTNLNHEAIKCCLKDIKTYTDILTILLNTETID